MDAYPLFWTAMGVLLCLLVVTGIWLFTRWLQHRRTLPLHDAWQPKDAYQDDQQGYQPQQPFPATYEEGGQSSLSLQEEPQALRPEIMPLQRQARAPRLRHIGTDQPPRKVSEAR